MFRKAPDPPVLPRTRLLLWHAPLIVLLVGYFVACVLYNLPSTVVGTRVNHVASVAMNSYFAQNWKLFGPNPATFTNQILMEVRFTDANGAAQQSQPVDVEAALDTSSRADRAMPTKLPAFPLFLKREMQQYSYQHHLVAKSTEPDRDRELADLDTKFQPTLTVLDRFLSAEAALYTADASVTEVRATLIGQDDPPPGSDAPSSSSERYVLYQSGWLPYTAGVGR